MPAGKEAYDRARDEYRHADWTAAKKDFQAAIDAGYTQKPSPFEDSAATYLYRIDKGSTPEKAALVPTPAPAPSAPASGDPAADAALDTAVREQDLRRQQASVKSDQLVLEARRMEAEGKLDAAAKLYADALHENPTNAAASAAYNHVLEEQGRNTRTSSGISQTAALIQEESQEIKYSFQKNIDAARQAATDHKFAEADVSLSRAQQAAGTNRAIFPAEDLNAFDKELDATRGFIDQERGRVLQEAERERRTGEVSRIREEQRVAELERQRTIFDLKRTAMDLTRQTRYREALGVVDQILVLDPTDDYARGVRPVLEDRFLFQQQRNNNELHDHMFNIQLNEADEKMTPYDDILRYPTDWPDISATRDQTVQQERGDKKEDRQVQAQLDRQIPEVKFDGTGLVDAIEYLRDVNGANIFVNWKSLETAGIDKNTAVTINLKNVRLAKALNLILDSVGGGTTKLGYTIDDGVITVSTADDLSKNTLTRVYDIRDLIINIPDFVDAPDFSLNSTSNNQNQNPQGGGGIGGAGNNNGGGGGGQGLFNDTSNKEKLGPGRAELVEEITKLITDTVAPDSWRDSGGTVGSIRELQGQLIVTQTPENQKQLVNLLEQLRETRAIQVTIETRFLTVQRNFVEDLGVNFGATFNLNSSWSKNFSPIAIQQASDQFTQGPVTSVPGSLGKTVTSLSTSATYLDDFQVQMVLRATQASQRSTFVQAPRVTLFNGQRAYMLVSTQQAYVSNLNATVGTGVSAFTPQISIVESGVVLDVSATVSADRKYVTLTLRPQLSTLIDLASFNFQTGTTANNTGSVVPGTGQVIGGFSQPSGTIQEPEIQLTEVKTTVSVPDGGTILLGGQSIAGEIEKEAGVPILSKIPFLKRLFTNRSTAKDEQVLLILVKPTIVIEKEYEQKQFPLLTSKLGG